MTPEEINKILVVPEWDQVSAIRSDEARFIYDFIKGKNIVNTLEIGFAIGKSASHIMGATGSKHIAIDPFQDNYRGIGIENLKKLGFIDKFKLFEEYSHNILPVLVREKKKFEFIFIDGDHKFDGIFIDFYYSDLLIEKNGYILLHDTWMRSTRLVEKFILKNRVDYKQIKTNISNFSLFQKVAEDNRDGMYFKDFYTLKSILKYTIINWYSNDSNGPIKKFVTKIKKLIN